ncbi:MAG: hypothetical protein ACI8S6_004789 [Myxococcota bacterium]
MSCASLVQGLNDWYTDEAPDMLVYNVLTQDTGGQPADQETAADWHEGLGLSFDVLADAEGEWVFYWGGAQGTSQHSYTVIGSDGLISWRVDSGRAAELDDITAAALAAE